MFWAIFNIVIIIVLCTLWFLFGISVGKQSVYKEWSNWIDHMSEIQKGWKYETDNHK